MGKGSKPRNCFTKEFKENYDKIFRKKAKKKNKPYEISKKTSSN